MASQRRLGTENAKNRARLIEAAETLLCEEGYAAVTARKVAATAGLKVPLVYYYFKTMDDLILEVVRKNSSKRLKRFVRALASPDDPLRALWELNRESPGAISTTELIALANHRESIRSEVVVIANEFRALQIEAVDRLLAERGVDREAFPAAGVVAIVAALTRAMNQDCALGVTEGYAEAVEMIESAIRLLAEANSPPRVAQES